MPKKSKILIVMAAGSGVRMGSDVPKQFLEITGKPILRLTIETFLAAEPNIKVVTVLPKEHISYWKEYCLSKEFTCPQTLVVGGMTRFHSVRNALEKVPNDCLVAVHDGVRPLLSKELISNMFERLETRDLDGLIPIVPMVDTLKVLDKIQTEDGKTDVVESTQKVDRSRIFGAQTPQMFKSEILKAAYSMPFEVSFTDDASVVSSYGSKLSFCKGERNNFKLTEPEDLALAKLIISSSYR